MENDNATEQSGGLPSRSLIGSTACLPETRSVERQLTETENRLHRLAYIILGGADDNTLRNYARQELDF